MPRITIVFYTQNSLNIFFAKNQKTPPKETKLKVLISKRDIDFDDFDNIKVDKIGEN